MNSIPQSGKILFAHPSPDLYGSDLQLVQTVEAFKDGIDATVILPESGPLVELLYSRDKEVKISDFPVLRKSVLSIRGALRYLSRLVNGVIVQSRLVRKDRPLLIYVNTITIPIWLIVAHITGTKSIVHVHEAEDRGNRSSRRVLLSPLLLADHVIVNSHASMDILLADMPWLSNRTSLIHNGIPDVQVKRIPTSTALKVVLVGRLSPRKGTDVALEAVALLRREGLDVNLHLCGECYAGYEWFRDQLLARADEQDLAGAITFLGYVSNPSEVLADATLAIVPSRVEPFGNVAVEALLASVPTVVADVQGLRDIIEHGTNGLVFAPGDPKALATEMRRIIEDPVAATRMAESGRLDALSRFGVARYHEEIRNIVRKVGLGTL